MEQVMINDSSISLNLVCTSGPGANRSNKRSQNSRTRRRINKSKNRKPSEHTGNKNTSTTKICNNNASNELISTTVDQQQHQVLFDPNGKTHSITAKDSIVKRAGVEASTRKTVSSTDTTTTDRKIHRSVAAARTCEIDDDKRLFISGTNKNITPSIVATEEEDHNSSNHAATADAADIEIDEETAKKQQQEEEERAKYMAQYHARPLEMDRRANATSYIRPSHPSQHIFASCTTTDNVHHTSQNDNATFVALGVHPRFMSALTTMSITHPTSIQSHTIPKLLQLGNTMTDKTTTNTTTNHNGLCIQCETGSGKTIAYLIPIIQSIVQSLLPPRNEGLSTCVTVTDDANTTPDANDLLSHHDTAASNTVQQKNTFQTRRGDIGTRAIIICPTRELATQTFLMASHLVRKSFPFLVCGCLSGGEKRKAEKAKIRKGISILIATPGRLLDHLVKTECLITSLKQHATTTQRWLVLDEVDRLLDMGLKCQIQEIVDRLRYMNKSKGVDTTTTSSTPTNKHWKNILVSATVTPAVLHIAKSILLLSEEEESNFISSPSSQAKQQASQPIPTNNTSLNDAKGKTSTSNDNNTTTTAQDFSRSAPHQLSQLYMVVTSKLRLAALISFLVARVKQRQSVVVFMSTCDSVDFHHVLFSKLKSILPSRTKENSDDMKTGIFGSSCTLLKLHGNITHGERQQVLQKLSAFKRNTTRSSTMPPSTNTTTATSYLLFATDVAARGLNLPHLDWIVQYDAPCEVTDYVHRVGRSARAGNAGHAILFLLPSEQGYIDVLKSHGLRNIAALSLSSTLQTAAKLCPLVSISANTKNDAASSRTKSEKQSTSNRSGEEFAAGVLRQCEGCVLQDDATVNKSKKGDKCKNRENLLHLSRQAFSAYIRAYPTKEKAVRHLFAARALHLGHVARSFALKESPLSVSKTSRKDQSQKTLSKRDNAALTFSNMMITKRRKVIDLPDELAKDSYDEAKEHVAKRQKQNHMVMMTSARRAEKEFSEFA